MQIVTKRPSAVGKSEQIPALLFNTADTHFMTLGCKPGSLFGLRLPGTDGLFPKTNWAMSQHFRVANKLAGYLTGEAGSAKLTILSATMRAYHAGANRFAGLLNTLLEKRYVDNLLLVHAGHHVTMDKHGNPQVMFFDTEGSSFNSNRFVSDWLK